MSGRDQRRLCNLAQAVLLASGLLRQEVADTQECARRYAQVAEILEHVAQELDELATGAQARGMDGE